MVLFSVCNEAQFRCNSTSSCIGLDRFCDGIPNCLLAEDEPTDCRKLQIEISRGSSGKLSHHCRNKWRTSTKKARSHWAAVKEIFFLSRMGNIGLLWICSHGDQWQRQQQRCCHQLGSMPNCDSKGNDKVSFTFAAAQCERALRGC